MKNLIKSYKITTPRLKTLAGDILPSLYCAYERLVWPEWTEVMWWALSGPGPCWPFDIHQQRELWFHMPSAVPSWGLRTNRFSFWEERVSDRAYRSAPNPEVEAEGLRWNLNCSFRDEASLKRRQSRKVSDWITRLLQKLISVCQWKISNEERKWP